MSLCARMAPALYLCQKHPRIFSRILAHRYSANWECCSPSGSGTISRLRDSRAYSRAHVFPTFLNRNMFWRKCLNIIPDTRVSGNPFVSCTSSHLSLCVASTNILAHLDFPKNFNHSLHVVLWAIRVQKLILIPATWAGWTYPFQDGMRFLVRWSVNVLKTSLVSQVWLAGSMTSGHSRMHGLFLQACCTASLGLVWVSLAIPARAALHQKGWLGSAAYPCNLARNEDIPANGPWFWCRGL